MLSTNQKGAIAEAKIAAIAIELGIGVSRPLADESYDLIFDFDDALLRVQCKWAVKRGDVIVVTVRRNRRGPNGFIQRTYAKHEIDAVAAYCPHLERAYWLPASLSIERAAVQLRLTPCRNNQLRGIHWARDFELRATLRRLQGPIAQLGERVAGSDEAAGSSPAGSIVS